MYHSWLFRFYFHLSINFYGKVSRLYFALRFWRYTMLVLHLSNLSLTKELKRHKISAHRFLMEPRFQYCGTSVPIAGPVPILEPWDRSEPLANSDHYVPIRSESFGLISWPSFVAILSRHVPKSTLCSGNIFEAGFFFQSSCPLIGNHCT